MSTLIDTIGLSLTPLRWRRDLGERLRSGESPERLLDSVAELFPPDERHGRLASLRRRAAEAIGRAAAGRIEPIAWADERYPPVLAAIHDPPAVLWTRGDAGAPCDSAVAIVGSRAGSPYAVAVAERLAGDLADRGVLVVSGLARGVDSAAHRGALAAGGRTLAVLGSGVDVIYPREHTALANEIIDRGALVSELIPGTPPHPRFFPWRNRIISGLSRAVVVVEAGEKSGSLITARCALEQGRDVLAVPGGILSGRNRGGHALLKDGARLVESVDDILDELGEGLNRHEGRAASQAGGNGRNRASDMVFDCLDPGESTDLDTISARTGLPVGRLLARLLELEMAGVVRRAGGGRYIRS